MKVNPKIYWDELFDRISLCSPKKIKNMRYHELVKKLIASIAPSQEDEDNTRWFCFYEHTFDYFPSREYGQKYFRHIGWEALALPEWKP